MPFNKILVILGCSILLFTAKAQAAPAAKAPCTLTVPPNALSAQGLATPYELAGGCKQSDPNTQSFVEATILDPATGELFAYSPLVITKGTKPAIAPVVPTLPANAIVGIWFGTNADNLQLVDVKGSLKQAKCVNGLGNSIFGQFASCNGAGFFAAAQKQAKIPQLGNAKDGTTCPTVRSFAVIDQDQSDNVNTQYLQVGETTAQDTADNRKKLGKKAKVINNGSDNALLTAFLDPAIGCTPFLVSALDDPGAKRATLGTDELQASLQGAPVALIPANDPMVLVNGKQNLNKINAYRKEVGQTLAATLKDADPKTYCQNFAKVAPPVIQSQKGLTIKGTTPDPATGNNLFTFLGARFANSFGADGLNCEGLLGFKSPITPVLNGKGVAIDLKFANNNNNQNNKQNNKQNNNQKNGQANANQNTTQTANNNTSQKNNNKQNNNQKNGQANANQNTTQTANNNTSQKNNNKQNNNEKDNQKNKQNNNQKNGQANANQNTTQTANNNASQKNNNNQNNKKNNNQNNKQNNNQKNGQANANKQTANNNTSQKNTN
ncbi:uncharacterized protein SPPG_02431 [Spizellomyces punctatus DAOM BR117]|uniref:Uncharacterized protein n=1 Tax=Spizellomyces punctatus (strain DAOM BR117) TaxID=645134 RepID=A0A0L0HLI8_SPIPD|nr:uncharacterized protein SPPG_02431 [Spizellomyces punctatus DAOM BR117]KND01923.1 hypothetical protein SPPG_02431 [Spizellomyces punctatus DAOM BR117]|eukprot:XP_016609962.1 hypothetical protein SPPG_02431 [Spizellomyces punctatus DAOM BR117]